MDRWSAIPYPHGLRAPRLQLGDLTSQIGNVAFESGDIIRESPDSRGQFRDLALEAVDIAAVGHGFTRQLALR